MGSWRGARPSKLVWHWPGDSLGSRSAVNRLVGRQAASERHLAPGGRRGIAILAGWPVPALGGPAVERGEVRGKRKESVCALT